MNESSIRIVNRTASGEECERRRQHPVNGLVRAAESTLVQVAADGDRTRYPSDTYVGT